MCEQGEADHTERHSVSRRAFLKGVAATSAVASGWGLLGRQSVYAQSVAPPVGTGELGRRYLIRGGAVLSMDSTVGDFAQADVLVGGKRIVAVGPSLDVGGAEAIDARGRIVMPASSTRITISSKRRCGRF